MKSPQSLSIGQAIGVAREAAKDLAATRRLADLRAKVMNYAKVGGERRRAILAYLANGGTLYVNCKWQLQTQMDSDIKRLLREKKVVLARETRHGYTFHKGTKLSAGHPEGELVKKSGKNQSYLSLPPPLTH